MPFRRIKATYLPKELSNKFRIGWIPVMNKMLESPELPDGINNANTLTDEKIDEAYCAGINYLKSKFSYIFTNEKFKAHQKWSVSTWSRRIRYTEVMKYGSPEDIQNLPRATGKNKSRQRRNVR